MPTLEQIIQENLVAQAIAVKGEKFDNYKHKRTTGGTYTKQVHDPLNALMTRPRSAMKGYSKTWTVLDSGNQVGYVHKDPSGGYVGQRGDKIIGHFDSMEAAAKAVVKSS